jgi:hypothetical protein
LGANWVSKADSCLGSSSRVWTSTMGLVSEGFVTAWVK